MLRWVFIFLGLSLIAGILGFSGISQVSADIAKIIFFIFITLFGITLVAFLFLFKK